MALERLAGLCLSRDFEFLALASDLPCQSHLLAASQTLNASEVGGRTRASMYSKWFSNHARFLLAFCPTDFVNRFEA